MCDTTQVQLQGIVSYHQRVAWGIHHWIENRWDPEEKSSFGTYNPTLLIGARTSGNRPGIDMTR